MDEGNPRRLEQRVNKLLQSIKEEGIASTAEREDLGAKDRTLLGLVANLEGALEGAGDALDVLETRRLVESSGSHQRRYTFRPRSADPEGDPT